MKEENIKQTIDELYKDYSSSDDNRHYYAQDRLYELCKKDIEAFIELAYDQSIYKRMCAIKILGSVGGEAAYLTLLEAINDKDPYIRETAVLAMKGSLDQRAVALLIKVLKDKNVVVRRWAASHLGKLADIQAIEPLFRASKNDKDDWVKLHAATSLSELNDPRAESLLAAIGEDKKCESAISSSARQTLFEIRKAREKKITGENNSPV